MPLEQIPKTMIVNPQIAVRPTSITVRPTSIMQVPAPLFSSLIKSVPVVVSLQADVGVDVSGGKVTAWRDQSGNANDFIQNTAADQPTYNATGLNGLPTMTFDGASDCLISSGPNLPAPGTTNVFYWVVFKQIAWANDRPLLMGNIGSGMALYSHTSTPNFAIVNSATASSLNNAATLGAWVRAEAGFTNSTNDFVKIASTNVTGVNVGNNDPAAGMFMARNFAGTVFGNYEVAAAIVTLGLPTAAERSALSSLVTLRYGSSVGV